jgi:surface protein
VSDTQDLSNLFDIRRNLRAFTFNKDLAALDISKVSTMEGMFYYAASFDQDLSSWNTSNVESMSYMFDIATSFNEDLATWVVSKVSSKNIIFAPAHSGFDGRLKAPSFGYARLFYSSRELARIPAIKYSCNRRTASFLHLE